MALINQNKKNLLDLSIPIQRNQVWNDVHKSNLIVSILNGFPVESLLFEESFEGKGFKVLDGKQRILTLTQFSNNEFKLSPKSKAKDFELQGKTPPCDYVSQFPLSCSLNGSDALLASLRP